MRTGALFVGALVVSLLVLSGIAWLLLRSVNAFVRRAPRKLPGTLRHGVANLYRPGNHAQAALVALGIGVMFTLTVFLVQRGMMAEMFKSAPPGMPNVFLLDITAKERDALVELIRKQRGIEGAPDVVGTVAAKIVRINGTPVETFASRSVGPAIPARPRRRVGRGETAIYRHPGGRVVESESAASRSRSFP